jgi:PTS system galactitol-specific IIA component
MPDTFITKDCIFLQPIIDSPDSSKVITYICSHLMTKGYIDGSYCQSVIEREARYPTGLPTLPYAIAIPHADSDGVMKSAIALAVLSDPVTFQAMDSPEKGLPVRLVLLLAIANSSTQVTTLQWILKVMENQKIVASLVSAKTPDEVLTILDPVITKISD